MTYHAYEPSTGAYHPVFDLSSSPEPEALPSVRHGSIRPYHPSTSRLTTTTTKLPPEPWSFQQQTAPYPDPNAGKTVTTAYEVADSSDDESEEVVFLGSRDKGKGRAVEDSDDEVVVEVERDGAFRRWDVPLDGYGRGKSHVPKEVYGVSDSSDEEVVVLERRDKGKGRAMEWDRDQSVEIIETYVEEGSGELSIRATGVPSVSEQNIGGQYDASFAAPIFVDDNGAIHQPIQNAVAGPSSNPQTRGYHQPRQDQQHIAVPFGNPVFPPNFESWMSDMRDVFRDALPNDINRQVQQVPIVDPGPTPALASRDYEERAYEGDDATCPIATSIEGLGIGVVVADTVGFDNANTKLTKGYTEGRALRPLRGGTDLGASVGGYGARVCFDEGDGSGIVLATKGCVSGMVAGPYVEKQEGPGACADRGRGDSYEGREGSKTYGGTTVVIETGRGEWRGECDRMGLGRGWIMTRDERVPAITSRCHRSLGIFGGKDPERDTRSARQVVKHPPHTIVCVYSAQSQPPDLATETRNFCSLIPAELRVASSLSNYPLSSSHLRSPDLLGNNISDMQISSFTLASTVHPVSRKSIRRLEAIQVRAHPASHKLVTRHPTCSSIQATQHVGVARNAHNHNTPGDLGAGAHWRKMASSQADTRRRTLKQPSSRVRHILPARSPDGFLSCHRHFTPSKSNSVPLRWTASMHDPANTSIGTAVTRGKDFCRDLVILGDPHRAHPGATVSSIWQVRHFYIPQHILTCLFAEKIAVLVVRVPEVRRSANPTGVPESVQYHRFTIGFVCALTPADFSLTVPHPPVLHLFCRHIRFMQTREK
ncbi:hypothetical protein DFP72DRAFT_1103313 [Ephemerocybe angulata]|uniref:Uncharacterized protein n=1 Tax=Ephemerocybe angulata TaxID=980116 RepID=A0A8H6LVM6_9AGAR|nr:hypothetical protein DFP72DRAFT_1103313 [Tulosesus angulatus]